LGRQLRSSTGISLLLLIIGLTSAGIWTNTVGYSANIFQPQDLLNSSTFKSDDWLWGRFFGSIIITVFARKIPALLNILNPLIAILMSTATGILVIAFYQTFFDPNALAAVGLFIAGTSYIFIVIPYYLHSAQKLPSFLIVIGIAASLALETICSVIISIFMSSLIQALLVIVMPLCIAICYLLYTRISCKLVDIRMPRNVRGSAKYLLLAVAVIFSFLRVMIRVLSKVGIWGDNRSNFIGMDQLYIAELAVISVLILLLSYLVFILPRKHISIQISCLIAFAVMLAGLQILAFMHDNQRIYILDTIATAIELYSHLASWMLIIHCVRETDMPPWRIAAVPHIASALVQLLWIHWLQPAGFTTSTLVMVINYLLFILASVPLLKEYLSKNSFLQIAIEDQAKKDLNRFSKDHKLTNREKEIFSQLLVGKKRIEIVQSLKLSEGTVKTHISNLYRRLGVHSKTEALALFSKEKAEAIESSVPDEAQ
jgi:DNA-binding CsgD family transcriptional regulator